MTPKQELEDIRGKMLDLLEDAKRVIMQNGTKMDWERARTCWWNTIATMLGHENMFTQYENTILNAIEAMPDGEDEEEEDE